MAGSYADVGSLGRRIDVRLEASRTNRPVNAGMLARRPKATFRGFSPRPASLPPATSADSIEVGRFQSLLDCSFEDHPLAVQKADCPCGLSAFQLTNSLLVQQEVAGSGGGFDDVSHPQKLPWGALIF